MKKVGRNDACLCGSGKKFKNCCRKKGQKTFASRARSGWYAALVLSVVVIFIRILWYNDNNIPNAIRATSILPLLRVPFNSSGDASIITTTYTNIPGVDFSTLSDSQRRIVLQKRTTSAAPVIAAILLLGAGIRIQRAALACPWRNRL
ncbi:MAG: SEC-C domain-containing protein [Candidatus Marinimicrobia bacterium]|nr:SEC-C domain-containing protein [Candidatus Neomarinimicrobiota bacterium]